MLKIQHSGGTGACICLVHKMMNYQIGKKTKTNKQTGLSATYYSPISPLITTFSVKFASSFFVFFGGVMGYREHVTNRHYFLQSSSRGFNSYESDAN